MLVYYWYDPTWTLNFKSFWSVLLTGLSKTRKRGTQKNPLFKIKVISELIRNCLDIITSRNVHLVPTKRNFGDTSTFKKKKKKKKKNKASFHFRRVNTNYGFMNDYKISAIFQIWKLNFFSWFVEIHQRTTAIRHSPYN